VKGKGRTIFSGIQPTGIPHLGNYLGALQNWVQLQRGASADDELFFSIVGLHAMTAPFTPDKLRADRRDMMATLLSIGLDPEKVTIFHQDDVPEHAELSWYFTCMTPVGKLKRMVAWKSKSTAVQSARRLVDSGRANLVNEDMLDEDAHLLLGLLSYPVLQTADILLYRATHVPVGEDQVQHLELARDIAALYNRQHKKNYFPLPAHLLTPTKRVLSLRDAKQKMSKSSTDELSRISLADEDTEIQRKIRRAITDGIRTLEYDPVERPGVSNLLMLLSTMHSAKLSPEEWATDLNERSGDQSSGLLLKSTVTEAIIETIRPFRDSINRLRRDPGYLQTLERHGSRKARDKASATMTDVRRTVGLCSD
jgi:tryptophanyl-tRNA synthetase